MFFEMSHSSTASLQMHQSRTDGRTGHCRRRVLKILVNELKKEEPKSLDSKLLKIISSNILILWSKSRSRRTDTQWFWYRSSEGHAESRMHRSSSRKSQMQLSIATISIWLYRPWSSQSCRSFRRPTTPWEGENDCCKTRNAFVGWEISFVIK